MDQNTRFDQEVIGDFVSYVNEEITCPGVPEIHIVNIDETNIDFDMVSGYTLSGQGDRMVSVKKYGANSRCTVLLGVTLSGDKLPPLIIFKGIPNGRIFREWTHPKYNYPSNCFYAVKKKSWIDQDTFLIWIENFGNSFALENTYLFTVG